MHYNVHDVHIIIYSFLTNMIRPLLRPSTGDVIITGVQCG